MIRRPPRSTRTDTLFPYTTLFRSLVELVEHGGQAEVAARGLELLDYVGGGAEQDAPPRVDEGMANGGNCVRLAGPALAEQQQVAAVLDPVVTGGEGQEVRSEEHTSELQSLMRISYAVFCLKKKKTTTN